MLRNVLSDHDFFFTIEEIREKVSFYGDVGNCKNMGLHLHVALHF